MIDIKKVREICNKATDGPWYLDENNKAHKVAVYIKLPFPGEPIKTICEGPIGIRYIEDLDFIAFARTALPACLDEIERLQKENEELKQALAECAGY